MDSNEFISKSGDSFYPIKEETVLSSLMQRYKIVIIESLITAFGLERMILDQHGGDVDTIHSVRQIDSDPDMEYKNPQNQANYENRGSYNRASVTGPGTRYQQMRHEARKAYGEDNSRGINGKTIINIYATTNPLNTKHIAKRAFGLGNRGNVEHLYVFQQRKDGIRRFEEKGKKVF